MIRQTREEYFKSFPASTRKLLEQMRATALKAAPGSTEDMKYGMPTVVLHGKNLVHYAAYANHIGFYPTPSAIIAFKKEISKFNNSKGAVQFPIDKPLPLTLVTRMVKFRVEETNARYGVKDPFAGLSAPAKRALLNAGINDLRKLSKYTEEEILSLHGIGATSIPKLKKALAAAKLSFAKP
jgi:uncharacterized protein YdhG (YjbR/CyaY superfamily)